MTLEQILRQQADYCRDLTVEVDRRWPTVLIKPVRPTEGGSDIFLQGHEAQDFVDKLDELSEQCPDLDFDIIERAAAYDYADLL